MNINKLLNNQVVFVVSCILATLNVIGYISISAYECVLVFGLAVWGFKCFTKHIPLQILGALLVSNVLFGCGRSSMVRGNEGFDVLGAVNDAFYTTKDKVESAVKKVIN